MTDAAALIEATTKTLVIAEAEQDPVAARLAAILAEVAAYPLLPTLLDHATRQRVGLRERHLHGGALGVWADAALAGIVQTLADVLHETLLEGCEQDLGRARQVVIWDRILKQIREEGASASSYERARWGIGKAWLLGIVIPPIVGRLAHLSERDGDMMSDPQGHEKIAKTGRWHA